MTIFLGKIHTFGQQQRQLSNNAKQYLSLPSSPDNISHQKSSASKDNPGILAKRTREAEGHEENQDKKPKNEPLKTSEDGIYGHCEGCNTSHQYFRDCKVPSNRKCHLRNHPDFCKEGKWVESEKGRTYAALGHTKLPKNSKLNGNNSEVVNWDKAQNLTLTQGSKSQGKKGYPRGAILTLTQTPTLPTKLTNVLIPIGFCDKTDG
jgi:hypothetical protein